MTLQEQILKFFCVVSSHIIYSEKCMIITEKKSYWVPVSQIIYNGPCDWQ